MGKHIPNRMYLIVQTLNVITKAKFSVSFFGNGYRVATISKLPL